MNYIKIYFALSDELAKEQDELADYIRSLNDFYHDREIFFEVNFSEDPFDAFDDFPSTSDNEENQIDAIRESNYFYLIFGYHDDEGIREKFDMALEEFSKNGTPKIYTYFKQLPVGVETEQGIKDFIDRLDQAIGHYYSQFVHIDSVKLNILLELTNTSKNGDKLEFEDGHATINGTKVLPLDNIPIYQCNESLQQLKAEKARLEQEFAGVAVNYTQNPNDQETFNKMMDLSGERNRVTDKIHEIEKGMLGLCTTISEMRHSDRKLTWREVEAGKRLDLGDYDGALMILRDDQREKELAQAEAIVNEGIERIRGYIAENRMIIATLETKGRSLDTLEELYARYEKNTELAKEYHIELDCVFYHMVFMYEQKEFLQAIELGEWLRPFYQEDDKKIDLLNLLGICYIGIHDFQHAIECYKLLSDTLPKMIYKDPEVCERYIAMVNDNLANLMHEMHGYKEAEALYRETLKMRRELSRKNPEVYEKDVAITCTNFASLLHDLYQDEEAETLYREALEINRRLALQKPEAYECKVAYTCHNLALLLRDLKQYEESEKLYREALEIFCRLSQKNPEAYENSVAMIYTNLAVLLKDLQRYEEAEQLYRESLNIRRRLYKKNPESYAYDMAATCNNLANLMGEMHRYKEAEPLFRETLGIYWKLAQKNPAVYESDLANIFFNFGNLMKDTHRYEEAEPLYREALKVYRVYAQNNPEKYEIYVARVCNNWANMLCETNRIEESIKLYWEAGPIYSRWAQKQPGVYNKELAFISYRLAAWMMDMQRYEEAKVLCCSSLTLFRSLSKEDPEAYEPMISYIEKMLHILGSL